MRSLGLNAKAIWLSTKRTQWRIWIGLVLAIVYSRGVDALVVDVNAETQRVVVTRQAEYLEDAIGGVSLHQLISLRQSWRPLTADAANFGFSHSVFWLHLTLRNTEPELAVDKYFELASSVQDYMDIYVLDSGGGLIKQVLTGDRRSFDNREKNYRNPVVAVHLPAQQQLEIYVRLSTYDGLYEAVPLVVWEPMAFYESAYLESMYYGIYYGTVTALMLYNLFLFVSLRQKAIGYYVIYVCFFVAWNFVFRGYALQYLWPHSPEWNNQSLAIFSTLGYVAIGLFSIAYLQPGATMPRASKFMYGIVILEALCLIPPLLGFYALSFMLNIPVGMVLLVGYYGIGLVMLFKGSRPARYYILAFTILGLGIFLYYLLLITVLPANAMTENMVQIGSALEVVLLAFGLADQIQTLKAEKMRAQSALMKTQAHLNAVLQQQVHERTLELEQANQRLASMAITDDLTGAYNRRFFNEVMTTETNRNRRRNGPFTLCIMDIDNFKAYNDSYGHQKGDEVLARVVDIIKKQLKRAGDRLFRIGGEEFALVLDVDDGEKAVGFVEHIRKSIEEIGMTHAGNHAGVVTASFGLLYVADSGRLMSSEEAYASADALLYLAKRKGRNRVESKLQR